jgi:hypothetical protein
MNFFLFIYSFLKKGFWLPPFVPRTTSKPLLVLPPGMNEEGEAGGGGMNVNNVIICLSGKAYQFFSLY